MKDLLLSPLPLPEFELLLENSIRRVLDEQRPSPVQVEVIGRAELCKRLDITEPTVIRWEKKGKIPCLRIGSAIRYNWFAVLAALEKADA